MRYFTLFFGAIVCFLLQGVIIPELAIYEVAPNIIIVFLVCAAILYGPVYPSVLAALLGLIQDFMYSRIWGGHFAVYTVITYFIGFICTDMSRNNVLLAPIFTSLATIIYNFVFIFINIFVSGYTNIIKCFVFSVLPEVVYNDIFALILFTAMLMIYNIKEHKYRHYIGKK